MTARGDGAPKYFKMGQNRTETGPDLILRVWMDNSDVETTKIESRGNFERIRGIRKMRKEKGLGTSQTIRIHEAG